MTLQSRLNIRRGATAFTIAITPTMTSLALAQADAEITGTFEEEIDVRVVTIPVTVLDTDERPVTGLLREEFELWVDGLLTPIEAFEEHGRDEDGRGLAPSHGELSSEGVEQPLSWGESVEDEEPVNFLVYLDEEFTLEIDLHRVLEGMEKQLSSLRPRDRVALVAWDGARLDKLLDWSAPGPAVTSALAAARRRPAWGLRTRLDLSSWTADYSWETGLDPSRSPSVLADAHSPCTDAADRSRIDCDPGERVRERVETSARSIAVENRLERMARAVAAATRSFSVPPGRRILALLAGAWPNTGVLGPDHTLREWDALLDAADQLGYTIYGVETQGMENVWGADVEVSGLGGSSLGGGFSTVPTFGGSSRGAWRDTLAYLAARTGGEVMLSPWRRRALARISSSARCYYALTFTAPRERDDRVHAVTVAVARSGVTVRSRTSFRDLSRSTELDFALEATLLGSAAERSSDLTVSFGESRRVGRGRVRVPLLLEFRKDPFAGSTPGAANRADARVLEIRVAAVDGQGRRVLVGPISHVLRSGFVVPGPRRITLPVVLRRTAQDVAVSIHDPARDLSLTASAKFLP